MLKILIVEDEDFERRALRHLINKNFLEQSFIIEEASNGKEALDRVLVLNPDIVLMDINMPIMNGLKATEKIKEYNKDIEIMILSAYDEFDYAKKAIKYGVFDYLLKPFANKDFISSLKGIMDKINDKNQNKTMQIQIKENFNKARPFIEKELLSRILYGEVSDSRETEEGINLLNIESCNASCIIIRNSKNDLFTKRSLDSVKDGFKFMFSHVIGARLLGDIVLFVFDDKIEKIILSHKMEDLSNQIKNCFKETENIDVEIFIGPVVDKIKDYNYSYNQAKVRADNNKVIRIKSKVKNNSGLNILYAKENSISEKIINEDIKGALEESKALMDSILHTSEDLNLKSVKSNAYNSILKISNSVFGFIDYDDNREIKEKIRSEIESLSKISDINNYLKITINSLGKKISNYKNSNNMNIIGNAKDYISDNFMEDIKLEDVAKTVSVSTYHFSRIFKKYEGINYIQYLIKVRMEKAKELLIDDKLPIKEIASRVGYSDQNYFSRAFKKYTGQSPREFSLSYNKYKKEV